MKCWCICDTVKVTVFPEYYNFMHFKEWFPLALRRQNKDTPKSTPIKLFDSNTFFEKMSIFFFPQENPWNNIILFCAKNKLNLKYSLMAFIHHSLHVTKCIWSGDWGHFKSLGHTLRWISQTEPYFTYPTAKHIESDEENQLIRILRSHRKRLKVSYCKKTGFHFTFQC